MILQVVSVWCVCIWSVGGTVLDPSLYLSPRPPLTDGSDTVSPEELWSRYEVTLRPKVTPSTASSLSEVEQEKTTKSKRNPEPMERAKLFWPSLRPSHYSVGTGNIQIPLTFSLSGMYGKYAPGSLGTSLISSSYGTVSEIGRTAVSSLAGTSYGNYRTYPAIRIYNGENGPAWSGWGNGKWGNYGKG